MTAIRLVLVAVAALACAWFALAIRSIHDENSVTTLLRSHNNPTAAEAAAARHTLARARVLDPDEELNILRAQVDFHAGETRQGLTLARGVVRREPDNVAAWVIVELMSRQIDPSLNRFAQERVRQLVPPVAPPQ